MRMNELTEEESKKVDAAIKAIKEEIDKIDWARLRQEGEALDRLIGWRSLTVEELFRLFTI